MFMVMKLKHLNCVRDVGLRTCSVIACQTYGLIKLDMSIDVQSNCLKPRFFHVVHGGRPKPTRPRPSPRLTRWVRCYPNPPDVGLLELVREKHTKKQSKNLDSSDDDDEEEEVKRESGAADKDSRIMKVKVNSLRTDLLIKAGLGIARNKVETLFYESKIRVNGQKIFKKSSQLKEGDEIDVIRGVSPMNPDFILVSRVEILSASDRDDGCLNVHLQHAKSLTIENYADPWKGTGNS